MTSLIGLREALDRRRMALRTDDGFSLLEAVVSLVIAGVVFSSLSIALLQTVRASTQARINQNAVDILNRRIETVRSLDFAAATEIKSDLAGESLLTYDPSVGQDPNCPGTNGVYLLTTSAGQEPVVACTVGSVGSHLQTVTTDQGTTYTVKTFVTQVTDASKPLANYRRVTVYVSWTQNGQTHTKKSSSFMTDTRRGLPLPRFTLGSAQTIPTNIGATLAIKVTLTNVGAPDAFNLTASAPASGQTWRWYADTGTNTGSYDAPTGPAAVPDPALTDTDGDTGHLVDTGILQVSASRTYWLVRTIAAGETATQTVTISATSAAQPSASTATQSFSDQILVDPATCTGCTLTKYWLHNSSAVGDTVWQAPGNGSNSAGAVPMPMDRSAPTKTTLYNYATDCASYLAAADCASVPNGRYTALGGVQNETDKAKVSAWYFAVPVDTTLAGTASLTIWARPADNSTSGCSLTAYLGKDTNNSINGTFSTYGTANVTIPATTTPGWQPVTVGIPVTTYTINAPKYLALRVTSSGTKACRVAYDTTAYNAQLILPVTSP